ncbi:MAG: 50S ribosomal protein L11 methyltransferase [Deltaproteobacteria bacterium]|jgi:predicted nicotinamide N-methyase|nr:50S ribosomal protein L11 methyltransferase [Deltaproteobacteria bacterium]
MLTLDDFYKEYETDVNELAINGRRFQILLPKDLQRFIHADDVMQDFPLWAKIWPASWVLAGYLAEMPVAEDKRFLEIGGGIGLVSIVAAAFGHHILMTEYNPDALQFARANALINQCQFNIQELDWNRPRLSGQFDYIVASEVSYREKDIQPLQMLFKNSLKTGGEVILAGEMRKLSKDFYKVLETMFNIRVIKKTLRSASEEIHTFLFRMTLK